MTSVIWLTALAMLLVALWWVSSLASRVTRAQDRVLRTWAELDAALVRRAEHALELAADHRVEPATRRLLRRAAGTALEPGQPQLSREQLESALTHVLDRLREGCYPVHHVECLSIEQEQRRVRLARRLHNDAVSTAVSLRDRRVVRLLHLTRSSTDPKPFEMADEEQLVWPRGRQWSGDRAAGAGVRHRPGLDHPQRLEHPPVGRGAAVAVADSGTAC